MSVEKKLRESGHPPPEEIKVPIGEMTGHPTPGEPHAGGHPSPSKPQPMNLAPPPKRDDSESSAKPPDKS